MATAAKPHVSATDDNRETNLTTSHAAHPHAFANGGQSGMIRATFGGHTKRQALQPIHTHLQHKVIRVQSCYKLRAIEGQNCCQALQLELKRMTIEEPDGHGSKATRICNVHQSGANQDTNLATNQAAHPHICFG